MGRFCFPRIWGAFQPFNGLVSSNLHRRAGEAQRAASTVVKPFLGGIQTNPVGLYPTLLPADSVWSAFPYLLPNLAVVFLLFLTFILALIFVGETNPNLACRRELERSIASRVPRYGTFIFYTEQAQSYNSKTLVVEQSDARCQMPDARDEMNQGLNGRDSAALLEPNASEGLNHGNGTPQTSPGRSGAGPFTWQVILQILSVSILSHSTRCPWMQSCRYFQPRLHKALKTHTQALKAGFPSMLMNSTASEGGLGHNSVKIGYILFSQAIVASVSQATLVPISIDKDNKFNAAEGVSGFCKRRRGFVWLRFTAYGKKVRKLYSHGNSADVITVSWSPTRKYVASCDDGGRVIAKRLETKLEGAEVEWTVFPPHIWRRARESAMPVKWISHSLQRELQIRVQHDIATVHKWWSSTWKKLVLEETGSSSASVQSRAPQLYVNRAIISEDRPYIVTEAVPARAFSSRSAAREVVFSNYDYWVCTYPFGLPSETPKKHFFLPRDSIGPSSLPVLTLTPGGSLLFPENGEVAIVGNGLRL
ncbi:MFS general substrate transporter [Zalerion maritima]|uniref:MFS general substrate transporter n=1 Tax=Zalerion maritima TaxID=339359 RepID=A0AAD5WWP2_9PEZI|nr:MFS general substrate transporter [Zalerion maritima]